MGSGCQVARGSIEGDIVPGDWNRWGQEDSRTTGDADIVPDDWDRWDQEDCRTFVGK